MKTKLLIVTTEIFLLTFLYFNSFFFTLNIGDTYYLISLFYLVLIIFIIINISLLLIKRRKKRRLAEERNQPRGDQNTTERPCN
jgi:membrane protein implicated in regulation of membrane protease activity